MRNPAITPLVSVTDEEISAYQMRIAQLEEALRKVRTLAIPAGAAFVRRNPDGGDKCREVLDIIDAALEETKR